MIESVMIKMPGCLVGLFGVWIVFIMVRRELLKDKYGLLLTCLSLLILFRSFFLMPSDMHAGNEFVGNTFSLWSISMVILAVCIAACRVLTRFSKERRSSIQEMALLRYDVDEVNNADQSVQEAGKTDLDKFSSKI